MIASIDDRMDVAMNMRVGKWSGLNTDKLVELGSYIEGYSYNIPQEGGKKSIKILLVG